MRQHLLLIMFILLTHTVFACTTFTFTGKNGTRVFGRNLDFPVVAGHIQVNYRNMQKTAFVRPPEKALTWVSKYGSISFNQAGREFPYGGMNEAGLVIEQMWLQETSYPEPDKRFGLSELQWIQYQLDNSKTVQEVIDSDSLVRISRTEATTTLHFLVSDALGNAATVEFIGGEMIVHQNTDLPYPVLANDSYQNSIDYKNSMDSNKAVSAHEWTSSSPDRFLQAARLVEQYSGQENIIDYSFHILQQVSQENSTQWSIVYDITRREIYYKTSQNNTLQSIKLDRFDFSCKNEPLFADITENRESEKDFRVLTLQKNTEQIEKIINGVEFLKNSVPQQAIEAMSEYAQSVFCIEN